MKQRIFGVFTLLFLAACATGPIDPQRARQEEEPIRRELWDLLGQASLDGHYYLKDPTLTRRFYQSRNYWPAWQTLWKAPEAEKLVAFIKGIGGDGLEPENYHLESLTRELIHVLKNRKLKSGGLKARQHARVDILLSDAFLSLCDDLSFGRMKSRDRKTFWQKNSPHKPDAVTVLSTALSERGGIEKALQGLSPQHKAYQDLKKALAQYRELAAQGEWSHVPAGPKLTRGDVDARVLSVRERLAFSGDLKHDNGRPEFDEDLEVAIRHFQERHGLEIDGAIGAETHAAFNVSLADRIREIKLNLERMRWLPRKLERNYVRVNIPAYDLKVIENERPTLTMNVVVGLRSPDWNTPSLSSHFSHLVLNPRWHVPAGIFRKEELIHIQKDPSYIQKKNFRVYHNGQAIDPNAVDWSQVTGGSGISLVQREGGGNALGRIKFMFDNPFSVYLHDTPSKSLFKRTNRSFSHGCVRVEHPMDLAEELFKGDPEWNRDRLQKTINTGQNRSVPLPREVAVHILYWTSWVDETGQVHFRDDIYHRNPAVAHALEL